MAASPTRPTSAGRLRPISASRGGDLDQPGRAECPLAGEADGEVLRPEQQDDVGLREFGADAVEGRIGEAARALDGEARGSGGLQEGAQADAGLAAPDGGAAEHERSAGLGEQRDGLGDGRGIGAGRGRVQFGVRRQGDARLVHGLLQDVERQRQVDRAGRAFEGGAPGPGDQRRHLLGRSGLPGGLAERLRGGHLIDLLEGALASLPHGAAAAEQQHRRLGELGRRRGRSARWCGRGRPSRGRRQAGRSGAPRRPPCARRPTRGARRRSAGRHPGRRRRPAGSGCRTG